MIVSMHMLLPNLSVLMDVIAEFPNLSRRHVQWQQQQNKQAEPKQHL